jgi:hypothetical protein
VGLTLEDRKALKGSGGGAVVPEWARIPTAVAITGLSRSAIYKLAAAGKVDLRKWGRSTLVNLATVRAAIAALPRAELRSPRNDGGGADPAQD